MTAQGFARLKLRMLSAWPFVVRIIEAAGWCEWQDALRPFDDDVVHAALTAMRDTLDDRSPSLAVLLRHVRAEARARHAVALGPAPCRCHQVHVDECRAEHPDGWREQWLAHHETSEIVADHVRRGVPIDPAAHGARERDIRHAIFAYECTHPGVTVATVAAASPRWRARTAGGTAGTDVTGAPVVLAGRGSDAA